MLNAQDKLQGIETFRWAAVSFNLYLDRVAINHSSKIPAKPLLGMLERLFVDRDRPSYMNSNS